MTSRRSLEICDCIAMTMDPTMLDLSNIQGNILRGYASFPHADFVYLSISSADNARALVQQLLDNDSVTPAQWRVKPDATLNLALTFGGLRAFGLPEESLATFPAEFQQGMRFRAKALGDVGDSSPDKWEGPGKTGRVLSLGYPGEGGELARMALPQLLTQDATYLVLRKLEQDVPKFRRYVEQQAESFARVLPDGLPAGATSQEFMAAKMMGRWQDGSSLVKYPDGPGRDPSNAFGYAEDPAGARRPLGAHARRTNPRDSLGFGGKTMSRRRLIRRGIPFGKYLAPGKQDEESRGMVFLAFNSGFDQFEFVQQAWINFGDDFEQGNDTDPIAALRQAVGGSPEEGRMMIPAHRATGRRPFICVARSSGKEKGVRTAV